MPELADSPIGVGEPPARRWRPRLWPVASRGASLPSAADALARAVHDLVAPLTVIRGQCVALARTAPDPRVQVRAAAIDAEAVRLAEALHGIRELVVARPAERRSARARIDLGPFVDAVVERHREPAEQAGVRIEVLLHRPGISVRGSAAEMRRLLDNLIQNALRHLSRGGSIRLDVGSTGRHAIVTVADDGPGVHPRDRERIFLPGRRGRRALGTGRGLGLAIAREIATAHRGALDLVPTDGPGAHFRLLLPLSGRSA